MIPMQYALRRRMMVSGGVALPPVGTALNDCTWEEISAISQAGLGSSYFGVGDRKAVYVSGTVGTLSVNGTYYVYIIDFDHNGAVNTIDFGTFKNADGTNLCLIDGINGNTSTNGTKYFNMNHNANTNSGGWMGCDLRYDILGSTHAKGADANPTTTTNPVANTLMAALPADLRAVMKPMTIYSGTAASVDYLPLPSEFELWGSTKFSSDNATYHKQYAYYAANSKVKYSHTGPYTLQYAKSWWQRSPSYYSASFCSERGMMNEAWTNTSDYSLGVAPIFRV